MENKAKSSMVDAPGLWTLALAVILIIWIVCACDDAQDWTAFWTQVEATPHELVLTPKEGTSGLALLRGSSLWENRGYVPQFDRKNTEARYVICGTHHQIHVCA